MSRRFQFSLRTLLAVMVVVAAFFGGMAIQAKIAGFQASRREKDLEDLVRKLREQVRQRVVESRQLDDQASGLRKKVYALTEQLEKERRKKSTDQTDPCLDRNSLCLTCLCGFLAKRNKPARHQATKVNELVGWLSHA